MILKSPNCDEIIRPILRGRDIQNYKANWQNLFLICSFPSLNIEIENYQKVKAHLLSFGYDRLKQTGETGARKKTSNRWFETQDQIGYWRDFDKPKIIWKRIGSVIRFSYDENRTVCLDSTCFATGNDLKYILGFLNSIISKRDLLNNAPKTGTGDVITSVQALEPLLIPQITEEEKKEIIRLVDICLIEKENDINADISTYEMEINYVFFKSFNFNEEEQRYLLDSKIG